MNNIKIAQFISLVVIVCGVVVAIGWIFNLEGLFSLSPRLPAMKFATAVCVALSGLIIYCLGILLQKFSSLTQIVIYFALLCLCLVLGALLSDILFHIRTGIEEIFLRDNNDTLGLFQQGTPSVMSIFSFVMIAIVGLRSAAFLVSGPSAGINLKDLLRNAGAVLIFISVIAIVGHIIQQPILYYFVAGHSSAMAAQTAALLGLLGLSMAILSLGIKDQRNVFKK